MDTGDELAELEPIHARHDDVSQQQIDHAGMLSGHGQRLVAVAGDKELIPGPGEHAPDQRSNGRFVLDHENRRGLRTRLDWVGHASLSFGRGTVQTSPLLTVTS
jgi:hypothetical protein